jgi:hypothetical protein
MAGLAVGFGAIISGSSFLSASFSSDQGKFKPSPRQLMDESKRKKKYEDMTLHVAYYDDLKSGKTLF